MKDIKGNEVKTGDFMIDMSNATHYEGCKDYGLTLWEVPEIRDGRGYQYNIMGSKYTYFWAHICQSIKVDISILPEGFLYSFQHGMHRITTTNVDCTQEELISCSDWLDQKVEPEQTEKILADGRIIDSIVIDTYDDFLNNIEIIKNLHISNNDLIEKILKVNNLPVPQMCNGELGIWQMNMLIAFNSVMKNY